MNKFWKVPQLDNVGNRNWLLKNSLHCNIETILKFARSNIRNLLLVYHFNQIIWLKNFKSSKNFKSWNNSRHYIFSIFYPQFGSWANVYTQLCKVIYLFPSICISPDFNSSWSKSTLFPNIIISSTPQNGYGSALFCYQRW